MTTGHVGGVAHGLGCHGDVWEDSAAVGVEDVGVEVPAVSNLLPDHHVPTDRDNRG